jgi:hypothetical protein
MSVCVQWLHKQTARLTKATLNRDMHVELQQKRKQFEACSSAENVHIGVSPVWEAAFVSSVCLHSVSKQLGTQRCRYRWPQSRLFHRATFFIHLDSWTRSRDSSVSVVTRLRAEQRRIKGFVRVRGTDFSRPALEPTQPPTGGLNWPPQVSRVCMAWWLINNRDSAFSERIMQRL